jgi:hypothetical protein
MGWQITCLENTLKISEECAIELHTQGLHERYWDGKDDPDYLREVVDEEGLIVFNCDHMEHQDFLWDEEVQAILKRHKASGRVLWTSADGDNCGSNWGYEFTDGECKRLTAVLTWVEDTDDSEDEEDDTS